MCNAYNHPPGCTCGWGGEGHLGAGSGGYGALWHHGLLGDQNHHPSLLSQVAVRHRTSFRVPTQCWYCGQDIYIYVNEYGSVVLFDDLGWPWPKHDCPHAPEHVKGESASFPRRFLTRMPERQAQWFRDVLEDLEQHGPHSRYAHAGNIPQAVIKGQYDQKKPTLEFLQELSRANNLRRGLFYPLDCRLCERRVWLFMPGSGEPHLLDPQSGGVMRGHHCARGCSSRTAAIRRSAGSLISWREVEVRIRTSEAGARDVREGETVIGFVALRAEGQVVIRTWENDEGVRVPVPPQVSHPVYTLVCAMPDPHQSGQYVIRAPTLEQFARGLPGSLPPIVREEDLRQSGAALPSPPGTRPSTSAKPPTPSRTRPKGPPQEAPRDHTTSPQHRRISEYPREFNDPAVQASFRSMTLLTLLEDQQKSWRQREREYGWHLGGLILPLHAQKFVRLRREIERNPPNRTNCEASLRRLAASITQHVISALPLARSRRRNRRRPGK
ncbi:hypothetical protein V3W47_16585 [Deinococcus sp. YIM 134068]|uniref:hypothetical protein n=1 Tax=Deinococcus lichenicola TaxID=3118910 RepID=UPI002F9513D5